MDKSPIGKFLLVAAAFASIGIVFESESLAQGATRGAVEMKKVGWINDPTVPGQTLLSDSYDAWRSHGPGSPTGVLRGGIYNIAPFTLPIASPGSGAYMISAMIMAPSMGVRIADNPSSAYVQNTHRQVYFPNAKTKLADINIPVARSSRYTATEGWAVSSDLPTAQVVEPADDDKLLLESDKAITTLVPSGNGKFSDYISKGDKAFRAANFKQALEDYRMAVIFGKCTRTRLAMFIAELSLSESSYAVPAFYVKYTVANLPKIMAAKIDLEGFYGDPKTYRQVVSRMDTFMQQNARDSNAAICKAFVSWFAGDVDSAKTALGKALGLAADDKDVQSTVVSIWKAMVDTGKVSGELSPIAPPPVLSAESQPASGQATSQPVVPTSTTPTAAPADDVKTDGGQSPAK